MIIGYILNFNLITERQCYLNFCLFFDLALTSPYSISKPDFGFELICITDAYQCISRRISEQSIKAWALLVSISVSLA